MLIDYVLMFLVFITYVILNMMLFRKSKSKKDTASSSSDAATAGSTSASSDFHTTSTSESHPSKPASVTHWGAHFIDWLLLFQKKSLFKITNIAGADSSKKGQLCPAKLLSSVDCRDKEAESFFRNNARRDDEDKMENVAFRVFCCTTDMVDFCWLCSRKTLSYPTELTLQRICFILTKDLCCVCLRIDSPIIWCIPIWLTISSWQSTTVPPLHHFTTKKYVLYVYE